MALASTPDPYAWSINGRTPQVEQALQTSKKISKETHTYLLARARNNPDRFWDYIHLAQTLEQDEPGLIKKKRRLTRDTGQNSF